MADREAYRQAGVDVEAGYRSTELIKTEVARTITPGVLSGLGSFGGLFALPAGMQEPVLVSGTDGVGTKLMIAFEMQELDTIGIDAVAMCVNDIICQGAAPLFFLDYIACGKNTPEKIADIVKGVAEGCVQSGCALIGGETAEMPGMYAPDDFDIAGFAVGAVDKKDIITGEAVRAGDVLIGLTSSGPHSNGYSLIRKIVKDAGLSLSDPVPGTGQTLGQALLTPTRIYVKALKDLPGLHGAANITGGGFYENIPRTIPDGLCADVRAPKPPAIFKYLQEKSGLSDEQMYATFNMGVGMVLAVAKEAADDVLKTLEARGYPASVIGSVRAGEEKIALEF